MSKILGRSRSLRMLRGNKEVNQRDLDAPTPPPARNGFGLDRSMTATPVAGAEDRADTPDSLPRPRTASAPGDRGKMFHKKVAPSTLDSETQTHNFSYSPSSKSPATLLYAAELHEDQEGIIGIALGSPTMASHWNHVHTTNFVSSNFGTTTAVSAHPTFAEPIESRSEAPKPKLSRWKSLFGKKNQPYQQDKTNFYQLAQTTTAVHTDNHHDDESVISESMSRTDIRATSPPTYKTDIRESRKTLKATAEATIGRPRARTLAENASGRPKATSLRTVSSPKPPPKDTATSSPTIPQLVISGSTSHAANGVPTERPLLDVDIPSIQLERYSVMFGNLLQTNNRSSSLLVRRQGVEKLKPLNELSTKRDEDGLQIAKPQRRATSPSFPKSPSMSLSLFPQATSRESKTPSPRAVSVHRPRPLQRSRTAPASSPHRQNFAIPLSPIEDAKKIHDSPSATTENSDLAMKTQLLTATPSSRQSFDPDSEEVTIVVNGASSAPWRPFVEDPEWEIVSKPATNSAPEYQKRQAPSSAPLESVSRADTDMETVVVGPGPRSADIAMNGDGARATVGVARSVSVSRANRPEFLKPTLLRTGTGTSERLVDRKPLTPTLVELKNRKSQRVQLVDA